MSATALSPAEVRAHVSAVHKKHPDARVIGIRALSEWAGPPTLAIDGEDVDVVACASSLEVRETLAERGPAARRLVIITPLADRDLGTDVLARLARRRLLQPEPWRLVMELFRARDVDARLLGHRWIADALLEATPPEGYPPVAAGVLDAETVWGVLLSSRLGLETARPDLVAVLRWSAGSMVAGLPADVRQGIRAWIAETAGPAGALIFECATGLAETDPVAIGLVLGVVGAQGADPRLRDPAVRLERFIGGHRLDAREASGWAEAAEQLLVETLSRDDRRTARQWLERADALLADVGGADYAWTSRLLPSGLEQRIDRFARALGRFLDDPGSADTREAAGDAFAQVAAHCASDWQAERRDRLAMALRAAQWLADAGTSPGSFIDAVRLYVEHGSFADWTRTSLRGADPSEIVRGTLDRLQDTVRERREAENARFASLLANWLQLGHVADLLTVERVLDQVVAPLTEGAPVLLILMDGMSLAVCHELLEAIERDGWIPVSRRGEGAIQPVLAAFPTITEVNRASLLSGTLHRGVAADEKAGFAAHPRLRAAAGVRRPPLVLHKGDLSDGAGGLASSVASEVSSSERRVVAVVLNAVDDHLLKADGVRPHWTPEYVQLLAPLMHAARAARRFVVVASDHGHVLDHGTSARPGGESDRWRPEPPAAGEGEVSLSGPRVVTGGSRLVAAWSERIRYRSMKNGYHGGASPQEAIAPLVVLAPFEPEAGEWTEQAVVRPAWWSLEPGLRAARKDVAPVTAAIPPASKTPLLDVAEQMPRAETAAWIDRLFTSERFGEQRRSAARVPLSDDRIRQVLNALDERGGRTTREALAARVGLPVVRLSGQLATLRQLLNVDGYAVLTIDEGSGTVDLNLRLLLTQFEL